MGYFLNFTFIFSHYRAFLQGHHEYRRKTPAKLSILWIILKIDWPIKTGPKHEVAQGSIQACVIANKSRARARLHAFVYVLVYVLMYVCIRVCACVCKEIIEKIIEKRIAQLIALKIDRLKM